MSTPRSRRIRTRIDWVVLLAAVLAMAGVAQARQSDKGQPININANSFVGSQDSGKITFTGNVQMDQGTFRADGNKATGYTDPNDTSQWQRVVVTGAPAHFRQTQDNGTLVHGQAHTIDYQVSRNSVILTGDASVTQQGRGSFHGEKLTYDTDTGAIAGSASAGSRVHITLQPRNPAPASGNSARANPPSASSAGSPPAASFAPKSASTSGHP